MLKKSKKKSSLKLAGLFLGIVLGLMLLSLSIKLVFLFMESKFDGSHKFNVVLIGDSNIEIVSLTPKLRSISILNIPQRRNNLNQLLKIPIDGTIVSKEKVDSNKIISIFIKSAMPFGGYKVNNLTFIDLVRLAFFARTVTQNSISERDFTEDLTDKQKNTLVSLTFNDPTIYEENQSIQIINATSVNGLGSKLANLITNIGGNPILVSSSDEVIQKSKLLYSGDKTYTVERISSYLNISMEKADKKGIADVIIIIGNDLASTNKF